MSRIPADLPIPRLPAGSLADIPIQRDSIGAMGLNAALVEFAEFKPYVYRGTGEDQFPWYDPDYQPPKPPKPKPRKRRKPKSRRPVGRKWEPPDWRTYWERQPLDIEHPETYGNWPVSARPPEPEPEPEPRPTPKPLRPSPGWRPMSGDDLDSLLDEIGE